MSLFACALSPGTRYRNTRTESIGPRDFKQTARKRVKNFYESGEQRKNVKATTKNHSLIFIQNLHTPYYIILLSNSELR